MVLSLRKAVNNCQNQNGVATPTAEENTKVTSKFGGDTKQKMRNGHATVGRKVAATARMVVTLWDPSREATKN